MWVADMDFGTPEVVLNAIRERLNKKILGYTNVFGSEYYEAFVSWTKKRYGFTFPQEHLVFSHGIVAGLIELVGYICDKDDKALILRQVMVHLKWHVIKSYFNSIFSTNQSSWIL